MSSLSTSNQQPENQYTLEPVQFHPQRHPVNSIKNVKWEEKHESDRNKLVKVWPWYQKGRCLVKTPNL